MGTLTLGIANCILALLFLVRERYLTVTQQSSGILVWMTMLQVWSVSLPLKYQPENKKTDVDMRNEN